MIIKRININDISEEEYFHAISIMSDERKLAIGRKKLQSDRNLSIAGEILARKCISEVTGHNPDDIAFSRDENGKPYTTSEDIHFNISHSGEYAVCTASRNPIGVDVEMIRQVNPDLTKKFCTEKELEYVFSKGNDEKEICLRLISIWTLKEAYFKCIGTGISRDLKVVEFSIRDGAVTCSNTLYTASLDFSADGYIIAVCEKTK